MHILAYYYQGEHVWLVIVVGRVINTLHFLKFETALCMKSAI